MKIDRAEFGNESFRTYRKSLDHLLALISAKQFDMGIDVDWKEIITDLCYSVINLLFFVVTWQFDPQRYVLEELDAHNFQRNWLVDEDQMIYYPRNLGNIQSVSLYSNQHQHF